MQMSSHLLQCVAQKGEEDVIVLSMQPVYLDVSCMLLHLVVPAEETTTSSQWICQMKNLNDKDVQGCVLHDVLLLAMYCYHKLRLYCCPPKS